MEFGRLELALGVVGLVRGDQHRRRGRPQDLGGLEVGGRPPVVGIDQEDDDVRLADREGACSWTFSSI